MDFGNLVFLFSGWVFGSVTWLIIQEIDRSYDKKAKEEMELFHLKIKVEKIQKQLNEYKHINEEEK